MKSVNVHEAKSTLSQLLVEIEHGEAVVIAHNGVPVARSTGLQPVASREPGLWRQFPGWEGYVLAPMTDAEMEADRAFHESAGWLLGHGG